ncbi:MAG: TetR/AcrR family transcriptional regulator [Gemmatimonadota bacterium]
MGSQERRERERAETRQKILDAAREMFVRKGYDATTMRAIARRIEYTPTAIYHHFRSKEALLSELVEADFRALAEAFRRIGQVEDAWERLEKIGDAYVRFALEHPMHYQFMFMTPRPPVNGPGYGGPLDDPSENAYLFLREACADAIAQGRLRPEYDDPDEVAQMLWAGMHGIVSLPVVKGHEKWIRWRDVRRTAARMREAMQRGLGRAPRS